MDWLIALVVLLGLAALTAVAGVRLGMLAAKRIDRIETGRTEEKRGDDD